MIKFARSILSNLFTLLLSLFLAIIIWANAIQVEDPIETRFLQIPVQSVAQPDNSKLLSSIRQNVDIRIEGLSSVLTPLTAADFTATVDLSQVPFGEESMVDIQVQPKEADVTILSQSPQQVSVRIEQLVSRDIPVELDIRGSVARGHTQGEPLIEPGFISVVGIASDVEPLDRARVTVFLNNVRDTFQGSPQPIFYNRQGRIASVSDLELSVEQVEVTIPVNESAGFADEYITVDLVGEPANGYRLLSVNVEPSSILVEGPPALINALNGVQTEPIDITGLTDSIRQQVTLALPDGITLDEVKEIFVNIEIEPILTTDTYNRPIELQGLGDGLEAIVEPEDVHVILWGPLPILEALLDEEVRVTADLFGLEAGIYSLEPDVDFPDQRGIELRSIQPLLVTVNITQMITMTNGLTETLTITDTSSAPLTDTLALPLPDMVAGAQGSRGTGGQGGRGAGVKTARTTLSPCHLVTLSPPHLVTSSPIHLPRREYL